ncbi:MAG: Rsd/AlgQ family anti-sigma factor [Pseudomonadota bacterium]
MTTEHKNARASKEQERRSSSQEVIQKLMAERAEMLLLYCQIAGLDPYGKNSRGKHALDLLQKFCQVLVDYIAAGHFSLYERVVNGTERRQRIAGLADQLYPRIADTTEAALDFNDKYDCGDHCQIAASFDDDLSRLGEELATRIELEDKLLSNFQ